MYLLCFLLLLKCLDLNVGNNSGAALLSHRSWLDQKNYGRELEWERQGIDS